MCGNGVVEGAEACDAGPANAAHGPGCRPNCALPACGDGSLYVDALGPVIAVATVNGSTTLSDDTRRALIVDEGGAAAVVWEDQAARAKTIEADDVVGPALMVSTSPADAFRDVTVGGDGAGRVAAAWEAVNGPDRDVRIRRFGADNLSDVTDSRAHPSSLGLQGSPTVAYDAEALLVAYLEQADVDAPQHVLLRRIPPGEVGAAPPPVVLSEHVEGLAGPPAIASVGGSVTVAWGDPGASIVYRRVADGVAVGSAVETALRPSFGGPPASSQRWSAVAMGADASVVIAGVTEMGGAAVGLQRFDPADQAGPVVMVSESAAALVAYVDVAADGSGNLAVAWTECGAAGEMLTSCASALSRTWIRWFYADLTPAGPAVAVLTAASPPSPVGVDMRADGRTALVGREGPTIFVRRAGLACPP